MKCYSKRCLCIPAIPPRSSARSEYERYCYQNYGVIPMDKSLAVTPSRHVTASDTEKPLYDNLLDAHFSRLERLRFKILNKLKKQLKESISSHVFLQFPFDFNPFDGYNGIIKK